MLQLLAILLIVAFTMPPILLVTALIKGAQSERLVCSHEPSPLPPGSLAASATRASLVVSHYPKHISATPASLIQPRPR